LTAALEVYPDPLALARAVADQFADLASRSVAARGRFLVALAGGSTPLEAYRLLASPGLASQVDWSRVHLLWGDERCVSPDHPDSNYRMAREALLDRVPVQEGSVHRIRCELEPEVAAAEYERELRALAAGPGRPSAGDGGAVLRLDLVLLGMGEDGHTASLFPGTPAVEERERWVVAQHVPAVGAWRVTLTPVILNAAGTVTIVVSGSGKAGRLHRALTSPPQPRTLPVQAIQPKSGRLRWMVDAGAAALMSGHEPG
jgi:6-phosphogluconolactonase